MMRIEDRVRRAMLSTPEERWAAFCDPSRGWRHPGHLPTPRIRYLDGVAGIRSDDSRCGYYSPGEPEARPIGRDVCMSDGHYLCHECVHMGAEYDESVDMLVPLGTVGRGT